MPVNTVDSGDGEPVVFLHSGAGRASDWRGVLAGLTSDYRCIAVDLFGYGSTPRWPTSRGPVSIDDHARLVNDLVLSLGGSAHVVGHSFGGAVALRAGLMFPQRFKTMVLIEPQAYPVLEESDRSSYERTDALFMSFKAAVADQEFEKGVSEFGDHYSGAGFFDRLPPAIRSELVGLAPVVEENGAALFANQISTVGDLRLPVLIIQGTETLVAEKSMCQILARSIPASRLKVIDGAAHMSPMTHPNQVLDLIRSHLDATQAESTTNGR